MNTEVIRLINICKSYSKHIVLENINIELNEGEYCVISGDNGSGKSTLFKIMTGLLDADEGEVKYGIKSLSEYYEEIKLDFGIVLSDDRSLYHKLTAYENLYYIGRIYGITKKELNSRIVYLLNLVGLDNDNKLIENFSTGMKKKLMIARALLNHPSYFFADELFNGLDSESIQSILEILDQINSQGTTVVIVNHLKIVFPSKTLKLKLENGKINRR